MQKIKPKFSRSQVKKAGKILKKATPTPEEREWADDVLTNWRGLHFYPINTFRATLGQKLSRIDEDSLIAQRLKRTPSIVSKLLRFPNMSLPLMQDLGGLRAVLKNLSRVRELEGDYLKSNEKSNFNHELINHKDYINNPKKSGYRGVHLVYKYNNSRTLDYNGLFVEIQIRTKLQHIWATSVETMGTFLDSPLKSSEGPEEWLNFFSLVASAFAIIENTPKIPQFSSLNNNETFTKVIGEAERLNVVENFQAFRIAANKIISSQTGYHHLISLDVDKKAVQIKSYGRRRVDEANEEYTKLEEEIARGKNMNIVLVATSSIDALKKAYPNYFLDTGDFIKQLKNIKKRIIQ